MGYSNNVKDNQVSQAEKEKKRRQQEANNKRWTRDAWRRYNDYGAEYEHDKHAEPKESDATSADGEDAEKKEGTASTQNQRQPSGKGWTKGYGKSYGFIPYKGK